VNTSIGFRPVRISVGEIARIAGVRSSAVSNWRTRHADFPSPVERAAGGDLFDRDEIDAWLSSHGKLSNAESTPAERLHAFIGTKLRESGQLIDHSILIILQALYLRMIETDEKGRDVLSGLSQLSDSPDPIRVWEDAMTLVAKTDDLARALKLPSGTDPWEVVTAFQFAHELSEAFQSFGELATSILRHYEEWQGSRGSEAMTHGQLTRLITKLLEPITESVYDPAAGSAMILADAWQARTSDRVHLLGQEVSEFNWRLGYLHLALHKANYDFVTGDTLLEDKFRSVRMDRIAVEPPFGMDRVRLHQYRDERWRFSAIPKSPELLWAQHVLFHLADHGVGVVAASPAVLFRSGDSAIRVELAETGWLDAVIDLPQGVGVTTTGLVLLVFAKSRLNRANQVLFINARQLGRPRRGKSHELADEDLEQIGAVLTDWRRGRFTPTPLFSGSADLDAIRTNKGDLSPQRYVRYATATSRAEQEAAKKHAQEVLLQLRHTIPNAQASIDVLTNAEHLFAFDSIPIQDVVKLGEVLLSHPQSGLIQNTSDDDHPIPFVDTGLVSKGNGHLDELPSELTYGVPGPRRARRGDLLIVSRGLDQNRGGCAIIDFDAEVGYAQSLTKLSVDLTKIDSDYLRLYLSSSRGRQALAAATTGSVIGNLRSDTLQQIEIPLPSLERQRRIAAAVVQLEREAKALERTVQSSELVIDALRDAIAMGVVDRNHE
jgi:hypothetical protein